MHVHAKDAIEREEFEHKRGKLSRMKGLTKVDAQVMLTGGQSAFIQALLHHGAYCVWQLHRELGCVELEPLLV